MKSKILYKYILLLSVFFTTHISSAQVPGGEYTSVDSSYRKNFLLKVEQNKVTVYGWELLYTGDDTLYFRAGANWENPQKLVFSDFDFSRQKTNLKKPETFVADKNIQAEKFLLYRDFFNIKYSNGKIFLMAVKDIYASKADYFYFVKTK